MQELEGALPVALSTDEVELVRFASDLSADDESPFPPLAPEPDLPALERSVERLVARGLMDAATRRPQRELVRRLLVVAQPDARLVLLRARPGQGERLMDVYGRAGAYVRYARKGAEQEFGPVLELVDVEDEIVSYFAPRASGEPLPELRLGPAESFAFSILATELALSGQAQVGRRPPARAASNLLDLSLDGAVLLPGRRSPYGRERTVAAPAPVIIASESEWAHALGRLVAKQVARTSGGLYELDAAYHPLALGLVREQRHVLTRFDYGPEWIVRDASLIPAEGATYWLRPTEDGGLHVRELDASDLLRAVRNAISELEKGVTIQI